MTFALRSSNNGVPMSGHIYLCGAGPGDPELLTLKTYRLLSEVSVVGVDKLVPEAIRRLIPAHVAIIETGRRCGDSNDTGVLHDALTSAALAGAKVMRLKAGDPMIFGRGGEEALDCVRLGIPFTIVPGISAALGAAAESCIPLTHRSLSRSVTLLTGRRSDSDTAAQFSPAHIPSEGTLVIYMASATIASNISAMLEAGWSRSTPCMVVENASRPDMHRTRCTLDELAWAARHHGKDSALLVIVGEAVTVSDTLLASLESLALEAVA